MKFSHPFISLTSCLLCVLPIVYVVTGCQTNTERPPNIIFVLMDDLGYGQLGLYNDTLSVEDFDPHFVHLVDSLQGYALEKSLEFTKRAIPTITQLAERGLVFSQAFTSSNICAPSRLGIATGILQNRWGIYTNRDCENSGLRPGTHLAEKFKALNYQTAHIGKWHIGKKNQRLRNEVIRQHDIDPNIPLSEIWSNHPELLRELEINGYLGSVDPAQHPLQNGFDYYYGYNYWASQYYNSTNVWENYTHAGVQAGYNTDVFTDRALDFMEQQLDDENQFYVQLHYHAVHDSVEPQAPARYFDHFDADSYDLNNFYAHVYAVDFNLNRIVQFLKSRGAYENTLIIFTSDNGAMCGGVYDGHKSGSPLPGNAPFAGQKGTFFQGGIRVPMFMHWPAGLHQTGWTDALVSTMDILPTAIEAAGGMVPNEIDGRSLIPLFSGSANQEIHDHLIWSGVHSYRWGFLVTKTTKTHDDEFPFAPSAWAMIKDDHLLRFVGSIPPDIYHDHLGGRGPALTLHHIQNDPGERQDVTQQNLTLVNEMKQLYYEKARDFPPPITWQEDKWKEVVDSSVLYFESSMLENE